MLIVTDNAATQIREVLLDGGKYVRAFIEGGGCSGFNYGFSIEDEKEDGDGDQEDGGGDDPRRRSGKSEDRLFPGVVAHVRHSTATDRLR